MKHEHYRSVKIERSKLPSIEVEMSAVEHVAKAKKISMEEIILKLRAYNNLVLSNPLLDQSEVVMRRMFYLGVVGAFSFDVGKFQVSSIITTPSQLQQILREKCSLPLIMRQKRHNGQSSLTRWEMYTEYTYCQHNGPHISLYILPFSPLSPYKSVSKNSFYTLKEGDFNYIVKASKYIRSLLSCHPTLEADISAAINREQRLNFGVFSDAINALLDGSINTKKINKCYDSIVTLAMDAVRPAWAEAGFLNNPYVEYILLLTQGGSGGHFGNANRTNVLYSTINLTIEQSLALFHRLAAGMIAVKTILPVYQEFLLPNYLSGIPTKL